MMDWVTWINTGVGIIGIIVGIIGLFSLSVAVKIKNFIRVNNDATIQQAQIIHNGLDEYAVIRLSKETTKEELQKVIEDIYSNVEKTNKNVNQLNDRIEEMPKIYTGAEEPKDSKDGDIWFKI